MNALSAKDRLNCFREFKNLSQYGFEQAAGLSRGYMANKKAAPTASILKRVADAFPELNVQWIMFGTGEMLKSSQVNQDINIVTGDGNAVASNNSTATIGSTNEDYKEKYEAAQAEITALREQVAQLTQSISNLTTLLINK